jgi:hypothetical protein
MRRGFIVVTFKNGAEYIALYRIIQKPVLYQLPSSFSFNPVTRKVIVEVQKEHPKQNLFNLDDKDKVEYGILALVATFDLDKYRIA